MHEFLFMGKVKEDAYPIYPVSREDRKNMKNFSSYDIDAIQLKRIQVSFDNQENAFEHSLN